MKDYKTVLKKTLERTFNIEIKRPPSSIQRTTIANEAVNVEKESIFIAIPKTGTTTVRTQLRQPGTPIINNPHLNIVQVRSLIYVYLLKENLGKNRGFPNHDHPSDADLREKAKHLFDTFFKFSAVRNPWARAVSLYARREGIKLKDNMAFAAFCEQHMYASDTSVHPTLHQNQYDWLCDQDGRILVDYFYKIEAFEQAIHEIRERTNGRIVLENVQRNQNPHSKSTTYRDLYNDQSRKIIAKRFEKDIDYFKYTF